MPLQHNLNTYIGAAVLGVISAAGMFIFEHYRQERRRYAMAQDLARLDRELSNVKRELQKLLEEKVEKKKNLKLKSVKANSTISGASTVSDDYLSSTNLDSSDLEFYDVSDDEGDQNKNVGMVLSEIDRKLDEGCLEEIHAILNKLENLSLDYRDNDEILWRIGKAHHKISESIKDQECLEQQIQKGIEACTQALEINPNNGNAHKWMAILIGSRSDFQPIQRKIIDGQLFKSHIDKAISINPQDPSLHHLLGRFDYELAGLKWYEKKVAAAFFGELPNSTYTEALGHFLRAENLANFDWKENKLCIAKCKVGLKDYAGAIEWLQKASNCNKSGETDDKVDMEIKTLLQKYNGMS